MTANCLVASELGHQQMSISSVLAKHDRCNMYEHEVRLQGSARSFTPIRRLHMSAANRHNTAMLPVELRKHAASWKAWKATHQICPRPCLSFELCTLTASLTLCVCACSIISVSDRPLAVRKLKACLQMGCPSNNAAARYGRMMHYTAYSICGNVLHDTVDNTPLRTKHADTP